ncbi:MAG: serine/threonine-protein phosphatase, partial [Lachnospiraceae bacterium]
VANIGDSRMYLLSKEGELRQITEDHSLVEEMIRDGKLDPKEAKHHPKKNVITRALGAAEHVIPDFFEIEAEEGEYILLCSDGLTNMVEDEMIRSIILEPEQTLSERAEHLINAANTQGGKDNISVILIKR